MPGHSYFFVTSASKLNN